MPFSCGRLTSENLLNSAHFFVVSQMSFAHESWRQEPVGGISQFDMERRAQKHGPHGPVAIWMAVFTGFVALVGVLVPGWPTDLDGAVLKEPPYPKTNLMSFLAQWKRMEDSAGTVCELEPQWVGTVKRAYLRGGERIYKEDKPNNIRFTHFMVREDQNGRTDLTILRARITSQGRLGLYPLTEGAVLMSNLPSAKTVSKAKDLDDLRKWFGAQHGFVDNQVDPKGIHWIERWSWFTVEGKGRLRYLCIFAHVSSTNRGDKHADIDSLHVTEGLFRPADPNSVSDRMNFKTGAEVQAETRSKYPLPLRSLVVAREDSDLNAYQRALNEIRSNPSPELFRQFAEWIHEDKLQMRVMLDDVIFDNHLHLKLKKWDEPKRKIALRALADALPHVKTNLDLDKLLTVLLLALGGGELNLAIEGTSARIEVKAHRSLGGARVSISTGSNVLPKDLPAAAEHCRKVLKERYPELR